MEFNKVFVFDIDGVILNTELTKEENSVEFNKVFVFDIDGVILNTELTKEGYDVLSYNRPIVEKINHYYDRGHTIILWTGRHWNHLRVTELQLKHAGVKYHSLVLGKPAADYYIDDKAVSMEDFLGPEF